MVMACIKHLDFCFKPTEVHNAEASLYDQWLPGWFDYLMSESRPAKINGGPPHTEPT